MSTASLFARLANTINVLRQFRVNYVVGCDAFAVKAVLGLEFTFVHAICWGIKYQIVERVVGPTTAQATWEA
eukprot:1908858-Pyramimonas_sp.AAC.1